MTPRPCGYLSDHLSHFKWPWPKAWGVCAHFCSVSSFIRPSFATASARGELREDKTNQVLESSPLFPSQGWKVMPGVKGSSPASGSLRTCPGGLPLAVGLISPPRPLGRLPAQLVVCKGLDQRETSSDHRGTERSKWFKQASRRLGLYPLLFQPRDMCFSGNSGNYLCPLRKGRVFSACVWGF